MQPTPKKLQLGEVVRLKTRSEIERELSESREQAKWLIRELESVEKEKNLYQSRLSRERRSNKKLTTEIAKLRIQLSAQRMSHEHENAKEK